MQLELKHIHTRLNRTMIYVTHDQEEALVMSDRIAVMNQGRIEQVGSPDELYDKPTNSFVANFIKNLKLSIKPCKDVEFYFFNHKFSVLPRLTP